MHQQSGTCVNLVAGVTSADLLSAEPQLMTTQLEKAEMVEVVVVDEVVVDEMVVDADEEVETLSLVKESLLAELDVERDEMRRKLLALGTTAVSQDFADGNEEVLDGWVEEVYKKESEEKATDTEISVLAGNGNHNDCYDKNNDQKNANKNLDRNALATKLN